MPLYFGNKRRSVFFNGSGVEVWLNKPIPVNPNKIYEFIIDTTQPDPDLAVSYAGANADFTPATLTQSGSNYSFSYGDWENAFFLPRPVMLNYDGTVAYELDENDFTKKLDGTASDVANTSFKGNCMIGFPQVWMKFVQDDSTHQHVYIANYQADSNYHCYTHYNNAGTLLDEIYIMAYNVGGNNRSLVGTVIGDNGVYASTARTTMQQLGTGWDLMDYGEVQMLQMLFILMYKSLNSRNKIGIGNDIYSTFTTGDTKDKGMFYFNKAFGIESIILNCLRYINGLVITNDENYNGAIKYKLCNYTTDGTTEIDYTFTGDGYKTLCSWEGRISASGNLKKLYLNNDGMFIYNSTDYIDNTDSTYSTYYSSQCRVSANSIVAGPFSWGQRTDINSVGIFSMAGHYPVSLGYSPSMGTLSCKPILT